jgi:hypothetical protein
MSLSGTRSDQTEPTAARKQWLTPLVGVGLWLASVTVVTGLVSGVLWQLRASGPPSQAELDRWQWGSREQKLAALREAYSDRRPVITDPRREEIEKFLTDTTKSSDTIGEGSWVGVLDEARFRKRVQESPWGRSLSWFDGRQLKSQSIPEFSVVSPNQVTSLKLMQIAPWAGGDEMLVFTLLRQRYHEVEPVLFWLSHSDGNWNLVDWEFVDSGWSEAESAAHWVAMSGDPHGTDYELAMWELRAADNMEYPQPDEYEQSLREVEGYEMPVAARDYLRYLLMNRWSHHVRPEEVLRLAASIQEPDRVPGVHLLKAAAYQQLGKTEEAFASLDHLEKLAGFRPSSAVSRASLLQQARRREDALAQWRRLADFDPGEQSYLSEMIRLLPKNKRSEILDRIKSHSEPLKLAAEVAQFNQYQLDEPFLNELSKLAKSIASESAEARQIEIVRLENNDQFVAAAALSRQAAEQETDKDKQQAHWYAFLTQMHRAGELLKGFAEHPNPKSAFHDLVSGMEDEEAIVEVDELPPLLAAYREKQPADPWLSYYEGYHAAEKTRFAEADNRFAVAERLVPAKQPGLADEEGDEDVSSLRDMLREQRCRVRYELGQAVAALEAYNRDEAAYQSLARIAVEYRHWSTLIQLNQSFAVQRSSPWLTYYEARALLAAKDFDGVHGKLRTLKVRQDETPGLDYYTKQLELDLILAEVPDPVTAYGRCQEPVAAFHRISQKLLAERDWDNLEKLCQRNRAGSNDPEVVLARLESAWRRNDHLALVALLTPWPTEAFAQRKYFETTWRERLVRSLLRLNRWEEAQRMAQEGHRLREEAWPLVLTYVAQKNAGEIAKLLRDDESFAETWKNHDFGTDPDLRAVLLDDAFAEIRQQQEFTLPNYRDGESLTLLLRQPAELTESWLRDRLSPMDPSVKIFRTSNTSLCVTWKGRRFQLLMSPSPFFPAEFVDQHVPPETRPRPSSDPFSVFLDQQASLTIMPLRDNSNEPWGSPSVSAREFGSRLLDDNVSAALYRQLNSPFRFLVPLSEKSAAALASRQPIHEVDPRGFALRIPPEDQRLPLERQQEIRKLFETRRAEADPQPIRVQVLVVNDQIRMHETFRVTDIRRQRYGGYELVAEYTGPHPNACLPELRPGIKYVFPIEQVVDWHREP